MRADDRPSSADVQTRLHSRLPRTAARSTRTSSPRASPARPRASWSPPPRPVCRACCARVKAAIALGRPAPAREQWPRPQDEARHAWDGRPHFAEGVRVHRRPAGARRARAARGGTGRDAHRVWLTLFTPTAIYSLPGQAPAARRRRRLVGRRPHLRLRRAPAHLDPATAAPSIHDPRAAAAPRRRRARRVDRGRLDLTFLAGLLPFVPGTDDDPDLVARHRRRQWDTRLLRAVRRHPLRGYVQAGDLHGTITLGRDLRAFGGAALRVHNWGVRDWGASDAAMQCS